MDFGWRYGIHQCVKAHRRKAKPNLNVANRQQGAQHVQVLLQPNLAPEQVFAGIAPRHVAVVVAQRLGIEVLGRQTPQFCCAIAPFSVANRAVEPLDQRAVGAGE